jgi:hypothetical protein
LGLPLVVFGQSFPAEIKLRVSEFECLAIEVEFMKVDIENLIL